MPMLSLRFATEADTPVILDFINQLAAYENMPDQVVATEDLLREWIFDKGKAEVLIFLDMGISGEGTISSIESGPRRSFTLRFRMAASAGSTMSAASTNMQNRSIIVVLIGAFSSYKRQMYDFLGKMPKK